MLNHLSGSSGDYRRILHTPAAPEVPAVVSVGMMVGGKSMWEKKEENCSSRYMDTY